MVKDRLSDFQVSFFRKILQQFSFQVLCIKNGVLMAHNDDSDFQDEDDYNIPSTSENDEFLHEDEWIPVDQVSHISRIY